MEDQSLMPVESGAEIRMSRSPETVLTEAKMCAKALGRMVEQTKAFTVVGGRKHLHFTAWQTLGTMFRVTPRVRETRLINVDGIVGFECVAEAYHVPSGQVVSVAESQCMNDEANWSVRPKYEWKKDPAGGKDKKVKVGEEAVPLFQLRSMAQTRACAKALRNVLAWVVVLAGYEATAAEEMTGSEHEEGQEQTREPQQPQRKSEGNGGGGNGSALVSEAQVKRMFALARSVGKSDSMVRLIVADAGFPGPEDVTRARYEEICNRISAKDGDQ
jgi:hypothetical protein